MYHKPTTAPKLAHVNDGERDMPETAEAHEVRHPLHDHVLCSDCEDQVRDIVHDESRVLLRWLFALVVAGVLSLVWVRELVRTWRRGP